MSPLNPYLKELGFHADDRVVVVHADDIGMCHATLPAIDELMAFGMVASASAMVPCPWFLEAASWHRRNPQFDLGIPRERHGRPRRCLRGDEGRLIANHVRPGFVTASRRCSCPFESGGGPGGRSARSG